MKLQSMIAIGVLFVLTACATNTESVLQNANGDTKYCYLTNDHTLNSMGAVSEYTRCMNDAGSAGYKKVK